MRGGLLRRWLTAAVLALAAVHVAVVLVPWDAGMADVLRDVVPFVVPLVSSAICLVAATSGHADDRPFWLFVGAGALSWGLGDVGFSIYDLLGYDPAGRLTLADAGYLLLIPLWGAALITHPARSRRGVDRLGTTIDAFVVVALIATVTTTYVLEPALRDAGDLAGAVVNTIYPFGDLALVAVLVSLLARSADRLRPGEILVALAAATFAVGDIYFARLAVVDLYDTGHPVDLSWTFAFAFVAAAAGRQLTAGKDVDEQRAAFPVLASIGIIGVVALGTLAFATRLHEPALLIGAAIVGLLVCMRLAVLLIDRAQLVKSLDEKVEELEDAHSARERFIATVSHDLRSPLASISGFAELLREPDVLNDPVQVQQMTSSIERNARRLARLTEDLLCAGQFATGHPPPLKLAAVDLRQAAQEAVNDMGRSDLVKVKGSRWIYAMADRQRVQQVLTNLVDNAFKHSGTKDVSITVDVADDGAVFEVADHGVGIPPEKITQIFEPFVSDYTRTSSVGLGLYVVTNLVRAMGGRVSVTSEVGRGTTFRVLLPAAVPESSFDTQVTTA